MKNLCLSVAFAIVVLVAPLITACGGGGNDDPSGTPSTFTVQGAVSGLTAGTQVTLDNNGGDALVVPSNGTFTFATAIAAGSAYAVTVGTQPTGQTCTVASGSGMNVSANVVNVGVLCSVNTYTVGGTTTGLTAGTEVTLDDNGGDALVVSANGAFTFATPVNYSGNYLVSVSTQPTGQTCTVSAANGAGVTSNVTSVSVTCSADTFTIGGTVTGLAAGAQVTLVDNGSSPLAVMADGAFAFATPVAYGGSYAVTVSVQPIGAVCTASNGAGSPVTSNVGSVTVTCSADTFAVGGAVSGLPPGSQVTLDDNGGDALIVTANGAFSFATPIAYGGSYAVTVATQPTGATCSVTNGSGVAVTAIVSNVSVSCTTGIGHAYVSTYALNGGITQYSIAATGLLTPLSPATVNPPAGHSITAVTASPTGRFLYVNNDEILQYNIDATTGAISPMSTPIVEGYCNNGNFFGCAGVGPLVIDRTGHYAYLVNGGENAISQFTIDQTTGSLTLVTNPLYVATGNEPAELVLDSTGRYAYVTNLTDNTISQYSVGNNGMLMPLVPAAVAVTGGDTNPHTITADPNGPYVYVMNYQSLSGAGNTVSQYVIGAGGTLTPIGTGFVTLTGTNPLSMAIDPQGRYAYVLDNGSGFLSQFTIGADGSLTAMGVPTVATGSYSYDVSVDPSGKYVYVVNYASGTVSQYAIGSTGALTPLSPSTVAGPTAGNSIAVTPF